VARHEPRALLVEIVKGNGVAADTEIEVADAVAQLRRGIFAPVLRLAEPLADVVRDGAAERAAVVG
jgi:hypothetical protein